MFVSKFNTFLILCQVSYMYFRDCIVDFADGSFPKLNSHTPFLTPLKPPCGIEEFHPLCKQAADLIDAFPPHQIDTHYSPEISVIANKLLILRPVKP